MGATGAGAVAGGSGHERGIHPVWGPRWRIGDDSRSMGGVRADAAGEDGSGGGDPGAESRHRNQRCERCGRVRLHNRTRGGRQSAGGCKHAARGGRLAGDAAQGHVHGDGIQRFEHRQRVLSGGGHGRGVGASCDHGGRRRQRGRADGRERDRIVSRIGTVRHIQPGGGLAGYAEYGGPCGDCCTGRSGHAGGFDAGAGGCAKPPGAGMADLGTDL